MQMQAARQAADGAAAGVITAGDAVFVELFGAANLAKFELTERVLDHAVVE
jgi:hypothetical protein